MAKYEICLHTKNVKLPPDRVAVAGEASATASACLMPPPACCLVAACSCSSSSRFEPQSLAGPLIWRCLQHALRAFLLLVFRYESRLDKVQEEALGGGGGGAGCCGGCAALASSVCVCVCDRVCVLSWSQILLASLGVGALPLPSSLADLL